METFYLIIGSVLILALFIAMLRFILGPTAPDRVVALDAMSIIFTAGLVLLALVFDRFIYMDVSLVYAVLGFVGVLAIARYLERGI